MSASAKEAGSASVPLSPSPADGYPEGFVVTQLRTADDAGDLEVVYCPASQQSQDQAVSLPELQRPPLCFVHGAWHGAWCYFQYMKWFSAQGFDCFAVSVRGHGNSFKCQEETPQWTMDQYVLDVDTTIQHIIGTTKWKPVVMGHSMGGAILQVYAASYLPNKGKKATDYVSGMFLLATVPLGISLWQICKLSLQMGMISFTWGDINTMLLKNGAVRSFFFRDATLQSTVDHCVTNLAHKESVRIARVFWQKLPYENFDKTLPLVVIVARQDGIVNCELSTSLDSYLTAAKMPFDTLILDNIGHDVMLDDTWETCAQHIHSLLLNRLDTILALGKPAS